MRFGPGYHGRTRYGSVHGDSRVQVWIPSQAPRRGPATTDASSQRHSPRRGTAVRYTTFTEARTRTCCAGCLFCGIQCCALRLRGSGTTANRKALVGTSGKAKAGCVDTVPPSRMPTRPSASAPRVHRYDPLVSVAPGMWTSHQRPIMRGQTRFTGQGAMEWHHPDAEDEHVYRRYFSRNDSEPISRNGTFVEMGAYNGGMRH